MDSGFYTSAAGMLTDFSNEAEISDNLANMQTPGYKDHVAVTETFQNALLRTQTPVDAAASGVGVVEIGRLATAPQIQPFALDLAQAAPRYTANPLNVALIGDGFLRVRDGNRTLLTRVGTLDRRADGTLLSSPGGYEVLSANGTPLRVPTGTLQIDQKGALSVDGQRVGQLGLARVPAGRALQEVGGGYYVGPGQATAAGRGTLAVMQGYLEGSNVDLSTETTRMLAAQRSYQANAKMLQMQDETLALAANDLGKA